MRLLLELCRGASLPSVQVRRWRLALPLASLALLSGTAEALAQSGPESYFPTNTPVGVRDRARPDYAALGVQLGGLELYPSLAITPEYDDNIYATDRSTQSDLITAVSPNLILQSNWTRNAFSAAVGSTSNFYASHSQENTTDYQVLANGRLDLFTQDNITGGFSYAHTTEPRTAEDTLSTGTVPVQYDALTANVGALQTLTRLRFSENFSLYRTSYNDTTTAQYAFENLSGLNNTVYQVTGRADYAITPEVAVFVSTQYNDRAYDQRPPAVALDRNSDGFETDVGASFNITQLLKGQAQFGYLQQDYRSASFHTVSGPAVHLNIEYYPTELTTVTLSANRSVIDAQDPYAISFLQTMAALQVDHELLPNVIVSGRAGYEDDVFRGVEREDHRPTASLSTTYLLNRHLGLTGAYSFVDEDSTGTARVGHFAVNILSLSFNLQL